MSYFNKLDPKYAIKDKMNKQLILQQKIEYIKSNSRNELITIIRSMLKKDKK